MPEPDLIAASPWLDRLRAAIDDTPMPACGERVHQLRIAALRLHVWLELGGWRVLRDDLRRLRRNLATERDLGVALALGPPGPIEASLRRQLLGLAPIADEALDERARRGVVVSALACLPAVDPRAARSRLRRLARRARKRARAALRGPPDPARLHASRRALRRLRFALEWMGEPPRRLLRLISLLGEVTDRVAALRCLAPVHEGLVLAAYRRQLADERDRAARRARRGLRRSLPFLEDLARCSSS